MIAAASKSAVIIITLCSVAYLSFIIGLYRAPEPPSYEETDTIQQLCDRARREPYNAEVETSCKYMQDFLAIDYKCQTEIGCHAQKREVK